VRALGSVKKKEEPIWSAFLGWDWFGAGSMEVPERNLLFQSGGRER